MPLTEEHVDIWRSRIRRSAESRRKDYAGWEKIREYYAGRYLTREPEKHSAVANWVFAAVRHMRTSIFYQNPTIYFTAHTPQTETLATVLEGVIHYERKVMDAIVQERLVVEDALKYGTGILKHGYSFEYGDEPAFAVDDVPDDGGNNGGGNGKDYDLDSLSLSVAQEDWTLPQGGWTEHNSAIMYGHPWVKRVSPFDFLVDPEAQTVKEARWMAHKFHRPHSNCIRDERYDPEAREELTPTGVHPVGDDLEHDDTNRPDEHSEMVTLYEIYDKETQTIIVISPSCKRPLLEKPYPYHYMADGPYEELQFFPLDDQFWAMPYPNIFTNQVEVLNLLRTQMMDHFERWGNIKGAYQAGGKISREDMNKWARAKTADMVEMQTNGKITDAITVFPYVPIPADSWRLEQLFKADFQELSGVSENAMGSGQGIQTATEASYVQANTNLRAEDMRSNLERFLKGTSRRVVQLLKQYWPASRVVPLAGPTGAVWSMMSVTRDMVMAEYDIDIEPGSTQRVDKAVRTRQVIDAMRELAGFEPYLQQHGVTINWPEMVKIYLELTDVFKNSAKVLVPLQPVAPQQPQLLGPQGQQAQMVGGGAMPNPASRPGPEMVNNMNQMPTQTNPYQTGRMFSEAARTGAA